MFRWVQNDEPTDLDLGRPACRHNSTDNEPGHDGGHHNVGHRN